MPIFKRTNTDKLSNWWWTVDKISLLTTLALISIGIFMMSSASLFMAERMGTGSLHFVMRHIIFLAASFVIIIALSLLQSKMLRRIAIIGFVATVVALAIVLVAGAEVKGARRWIRIYGISVQPSEFIKPFFAITNAWILSIAASAASRFALSALICASPVVLMLLQPDVGMSVIVIVVWAVQIFVFGIRLRWLFALFAAMLLAGIIFYITFEHVRVRVKSFTAPAAQTSYQVKKSLESFRTGGAFGVGPAEGKVKLKLPDAHTDFVFAVIAEELGIVFCNFVIALFLLLFYRFYRGVVIKNDPFIIVAASGLIAQLAMQVFINIGANIKLLPAKGTTLPFMSYGGSSALATGVLLGMLFSLSRKTFDLKDLSII